MKVLQFNLKAFIHIDFTHFKINCLDITFVNHSNPNSSLLCVSVHNTVIYIQYSIINSVSCGYDTRLIVYITCVLSTIAERTYQVFGIVAEER